MRVPNWALILSTDTAIAVIIPCVVLRTNAKLVTLALHVIRCLSRRIILPMGAVMAVALVLSVTHVSRLPGQTVLLLPSLISRLASWKSTASIVFFPSLLTVLAFVFADSQVESTVLPTLASLQVESKARSLAEGFLSVMGLLGCLARLVPTLTIFHAPDVFGSTTSRYVKRRQRGKTVSQRQKCMGRCISLVDLADFDDC